MKPLIICAAITGGAPARSKTPHHPVTPHAVADEMLACWRAGASMIHIHARLDDGSTVMDPDAYRAIIDRVTPHGFDAIVNVSAGDDGGKASHDMRYSVADCGAEMVSLDAGPINIAGRVYNNSPAYLTEMARRLKDRGIKPEIEIFDAGHLTGISALAEQGLLAAPHYIQFAFGVPGGLPVDPRYLTLLLERLPDGSEWAISAQTNDVEAYLQLSMQAFVHGGHVRCGMEDLIYLRPGELARSNADSVEQWVRTAEIWGRPVASPAAARSLLGISQ
ncbi:MAG: 3-keto-5-aminohexanoate cleavage protein [Alphaproteobacteria bacterium]|nr:3-keto-5-aminohexanoate cleavage protein [Alphaproteobacteria bacterium]